MVFWSSSEIVCAVIGGVIFGLGTHLELSTFGKITSLNDFLLAGLNFRHNKHLIHKLFMLMGFLTIPYFVNTFSDGILDIQITDIQILDNTFIIYNSLNWVGWFLAGMLVGIGTIMIGSEIHSQYLLPLHTGRSLIIMIFTLIGGFAMTTIRDNFHFINGHIPFPKIYSRQDTY